MSLCKLKVSSICILLIGSLKWALYAGGLILHIKHINIEGKVNYEEKEKS